MSGNTKYLSREDIFSINDVVREEVEVPEWGGSVWVGTISARAALEIMTRAEKIKGGDEGEALVYNAGLLLARSVTGQDGRPVFTEDDIPRLMEKSEKAVNRLFMAALKLNPLGDAGEAEKNSGGEAGGDSPTASPMS